MWPSWNSAAWRGLYGVCVAAVCATMVGCETTCPGRNPACEDAYSSTRLVIHTGGWPGQRAVWSDAEVELLGTEADGTGWSVGAVGDAVVVGLPEARRVHLVDASPGTRALAEATRRSWTAPAAGFGAAVATSIPDAGGAWGLWVGAPDAATYRGEVHLFDDAPGTSTARLVLRGTAPGDHLGRVVIRCPDLTGDRAPDWLVAAPGFSGPPDGDVPSLAGAVWLIASEDLAGESGVATVTDLARRGWWGTSTGARLGASLACRHDLTGDGFPDLVLGAPLHGAEDPGRVVVLDGTDLPEGGPLAEGWRTLDSATSHAWLGSSVATGDVDGDGAVDLLVGAPGTRTGTGSALLYAGAALRADPDDLAPMTTFDLRGNPSDHLGATVAVGRADDDGPADPWVAAPERSTSEAWAEGSLYGFAGRATWPATLIADEDADHHLEGRRAFQRVGGTLHLHDLDGDGLDDLILATRQRPSP